METRIKWIDSAKGLGMLLVIFAHASIPHIIRKEIFTFHMPLFFFISGYVFNMGKYPKYKTFIIKKIKSLAIPYVLLSGLLWLYYVSANVLVNVLHKKSSVLTPDLLKPLLGTIYAIRNTEWTSHNGTLWFVACLFITELLFYLIAKVGAKKNRNIFIILLFFSIFGYLYSKYIIKPLPWSIDAALTAVVFYGIGYIFKEKNFLLSVSNLKVFIILSCINLLSGFYNPRISMFGNVYGNYFLFYLSAFSGVIAFIILVRLVKESNILLYIGKNSIIYLALHQAVVFPIISVVLIKLFRFDGLFMQNSVIWGSFYTVASIVLIMPVIYIINNYFPFMIGHRKKEF